MTTTIITASGSLYPLRWFTLYGANPTFATARSTVNASLDSGHYCGQYYSGGNYYVYRFSVSFDTSVIGVGQTVTRAYLKMTTQQIITTAGAFDILVVKAAYTDGDYNTEAHYDLGLSEATDVTFANSADLTVGVETSSPDLDVSRVNVTGWTKLMIVGGTDRSNAPVTASEGQAQRLCFYSPNTFLAESLRPKLVVEHSAAATAARSFAVIVG